VKLQHTIGAPKRVLWRSELSGKLHSKTEEGGRGFKEVGRGPASDARKASSIKKGTRKLKPFVWGGGEGM